MSEESEHALDAAAEPDAGEAHSHIHMPPNSGAPIFAALSLAVLFVGLLGDIRNTLGPTMWLIGLLGVIASCAVWARGAVREFRELPEESHN
ncbi:MAG: hypothetical protein JOZ46_10595 [Candidatus Dormibacteraeota bacterium]|nr:hypothetical protein [Candidatus Dormibacteraeota bacterium]MBV9526247.1 hypothetical protein [Candidatus Dormibacteraeota bacterium]